MARVPPSDPYQSSDGSTTDSDGTDSSDTGDTSDGSSSTTQTPEDPYQAPDGSTPPSDGGDTGGSGGSDPADSRREETVTETEPETADDPSIPESSSDDSGSDPADSRRERTVTETEPETADDPSIPDSSDGDTGTTQPPEQTAGGGGTGFDRNDANRDGSTAREQAVESAETQQSEGTLGEQEQRAIQAFTSQSGTYDRDDIAGAERTEGGVWEFELTEEGETTYFGETTDRASQSVSLSTTGVGTTGTRQSRLREQTVRANQSISLGTTGAGATVDQIDDEAAAREGVEQNEEMVAEVRQEQVEADAKNEVREQVAEQIREQGGNPENFQITVSETDDGQIRAGAERAEEPDEQFGDWVVAVPSARESEGVVEQTLENAAGTMFGPAGAATDEVAEAAGTLTGTEGTRLENVLGAGGDRIREGIDSTSEQGGDAVEDAAVSGALGPAFGRQTSSDLADLGIALADEQTGVNVEQQVDAYTEGVYSGGAAVGNVPDTVVSLKEATEFAGYSAQEVAAGESDELASDVSDRGTAIATRAVSQAQANPTSTAGRLAGGLTVSTLGMGAAGAVSSRAGTAARYAIQPGEELATGAVRTGLRGTRLGSTDPVDSARSAISRAKVEASRLQADTDAQARLTGGGGRSRQLGDSESSGTTSDEVDLLDRQSADDLRQDETARLARQAQQQAEYEVEQQYGDRVRETLPEVDDTVTKQTRAADDIQPGAQRGGDPEVASGEDITFEENFQRSIRETRRESYFEEAEFSQRLSRDRGTGISGRYQQPELDATPQQDLRQLTRSRTTNAELDADRSFGGIMRGIRSSEADAVQEPRLDEDVLATKRADEATEADDREETRERTDTDERVDLRERTDVDQRPEVKVENLFETEQRTDARQEFTTETRQEFETEVETEARFETRTEFRLDARSESRRESEFDIDGSNDGNDILLGGDPGGEEQRFEYEARDLR